MNARRVKINSLIFFFASPKFLSLTLNLYLIEKKKSHRILSSVYDFQYSRKSVGHFQTFFPMVATHISCRLFFTNSKHRLTFECVDAWFSFPPLSHQWMRSIVISFLNVSKQSGSPNINQRCLSLTICNLTTENFQEKTKKKKKRKRTHNFRY